MSFSTPGVIKGVFIDTETGGLDPKVHGITEIAAAQFTITLQDEVPLVKIGRSIQTWVKPSPWLAYCPGALAMQSRPGVEMTLDYLHAHGRPEIQVVGMLQSFLHNEIYPNVRYWNHSIWAQNADFDHGFLLALQKRVGKDYPKATSNVQNKELGARGLTPYGHLEMFAERCDWSCTRKLFSQLGALGIGKVQEQGSKVSLKDIMPYYLIDKPKTHSALQDCHDGILCLSYMLHDQYNYYRAACK